ncbi:MAG: hypothetical protein ACE5MH_05120 [Terriglobia bacterium]
MGRILLLAMGFGGLGVVLSTLIIWWVASTRSAFSTELFFLGYVLSVGGVLGGAALGRWLLDWRRFRSPTRILILVILLILIGGVFSALAAYLAHVVTVMTWYAGELPAEQSGFLYLVFHPADVPSIVEVTEGGLKMEETAIWGLVMGGVAGLLGTFLFIVYEAPMISGLRDTFKALNWLLEKFSDVLHASFPRRGKRP